MNKFFLILLTLVLIYSPTICSLDFTEWENNKEKIYYDAFECNKKKHVILRRGTITATCITDEKNMIYECCDLDKETIAPTEDALHARSIFDLLYMMYFTQKYDCML